MKFFEKDVGTVYKVGDKVQYLCLRDNDLSRMFNKAWGVVVRVIEPRGSYFWHRFHVEFKHPEAARVVVMVPTQSCNLWSREELDLKNEYLESIRQLRYKTDNDVVKSLCRKEMNLYSGRGLG